MKMKEYGPKLRGVNLGSWFVMESWQLPSLFDGTGCRDEYSLTKHLGAKASTVIRKHRETFIQEADFKWLADHGLNAVRIPVGYWILKDQEGFISSPEILDFAVDCCQKYGLYCLLDLHGVPGHQSGEHHSGRSNLFLWSKEEKYLDLSLAFVEEIAERYAGRDCVHGIFLVNEPCPSIPAEFLLKYFKLGYGRVRKHLPVEQTAVITTAFPETRLPEICGHIVPPEYENIMIDLHNYYCFGEDNQKLPMSEHLKRPLDHKTFEEYGRKERLLIGEWSLSMPFNQDVNELEKECYYRAFAATQLIAYEKTDGWFFWSYKTENRPNWSFRDAVEMGWFPPHFHGEMRK